MSSLKKIAKSLLGHFGWLILRLNNIRSICSIKTVGVYSIILHDVPQCDRDRLKCLLDVLLENYTFITPDNFVSYLNGDYHLTENQLLLTFDDGYYSNYLVAKDILKSRDIKAIFFISTGFINLKDRIEIEKFIKESFYNNQLPSELDINEMTPMIWENISELVELGHTIGAHTINHVYLSSLVDNDLLEEEIISSGDCIKEVLGINVNHFAFPFGDISSVNKNAIEVAAKRYKYVYSGIRGRNSYGTNPFAIRREALDIGDSYEYNRFVAGGGLSFYYWRARRLLDAMIT